VLLLLLLLLLLPYLLDQLRTSFFISCTSSRMSSCFDALYPILTRATISWVAAGAALYRASQWVLKPRTPCRVITK
jgi:hypothetical protein